MISWQLFSSVAVAVASIAIICKYCGNPSSYPPGYRGFPLAGVLPLAGDYPQRTFTKWSIENYGPIFFVNFGQRRQIILNTANSIKEAFLTNSVATSGRPISYIFDQQNGITFLDDTRKFRIQKNFGQTVMKSIEAHENGIQTVIQKEGKRFLDYLSSLENKPIDLAPLTFRMSGNILTKVLLGQRYDYIDDSNIVLAQKGVLAGSEDFKKIVAIEVIPLLRHFPPFTGILRRYAERGAVIIDLLRVFVEEHKKNFDENKLDDFIDYFIKEQKNGPHPITRGFTDEQLINYLGNVLGGGIANASVSLLWMVLCALRNPDVHERIVKEVDKIYGKDKEPSWEGRLELPYTCAFMDEVWRTTAPLSRTVTHKTNAEVKISEFIIPKDSEISGNIWGAHHDAKLWPNPMKFDPSRHLDKDGNFVGSENLIPFGVGPRSCFAEHLARVEVYIMFVKLLQRYDISSSGPLPGIYDGVETITYDPKPFNVVLKPRS